MTSDREWRAAGVTREQAMGEQALLATHAS